MAKTLIFIVFLFPCLAISQITEGKLYRETSKPEVYVIHDGKKVWIPTPDALKAMGYTWSQVNVVADGSLHNLPEFRIKSASPTPSSLIFPPDIPSFGSFDKSHHPVKINTSTRVMVNSHVPSAGFQEVQLVEIRGWLDRDLVPFSADGKENPEGAGYDWSFNLIPDYKWLKAQGIDINKIIRVGNITSINQGVVKGEIAKNMVSIPALHVEVNSWLWRGRRPPNLPQAPTDWIKLGPLTSTVAWPFNPNFKTGQYVRVFGSLVTDSPHPTHHYWNGEIDRWSPYWGCRAEQECHYARWTEIHPADLIQPDPIQQTQTETTYGLILYANVDESNQISVDLAPPLDQKPNDGNYYEVAYEEILGPECQNPNPGNPQKPHYTKVQKLGDHINVFAITHGGGSLSGTPGRIRALYRVWWEKTVKKQNMLASAGNLVFTSTAVKVNISSRNAAGQPIQGEVFDQNGVKLGNTNSVISIPTPCNIIEKTVKKQINIKPPRFVNSPCQIITCTPSEKELVVKATGFNDAKVKLTLAKNSCN